MTCETHEHHDHVHSVSCGHTVIKYEGYADYLHDDHLHYEYNGHYGEYAPNINETNPGGCHPADTCHGHVHGESYDHEAVLHSDRVDYIVSNRLYHQRGDHCGDHGPAEVIK